MASSPTSLVWIQFLGWNSSTITPFPIFSLCRIWLSKLSHILMFVPTGLTWHVHRRWTSTSPSLCQVVKLSSWLSSSIIFSPASENLSSYVWDCCASADMRCALVLGNRASQQGYCNSHPPCGPRWWWNMSRGTFFRINGRCISSLAILLAEVLCCLALPWCPLTPCPVWPSPLFLLFPVRQSSLRLFAVRRFWPPCTFMFLSLSLVPFCASRCCSAFSFFYFFLLLEKLGLGCIRSRWPTWTPSFGRGGSAGPVSPTGADHQPNQTKPSQAKPSQAKTYIYIYTHNIYIYIYTYIYIYVIPRRAASQIGMGTTFPGLVGGMRGILPGGPWRRGAGGGFT